MPVFILEKNSKMDFPFNVPESRLVKISLEASSPVDIFIAKPDIASKISSRKSATELGAILFPNLSKMDNQVITIPGDWASWVLGVGVAEVGKDIAVYYQVNILPKINPN